MDVISQTIFSNAFSSMKMFEFRLKFHWSLFPMVQLMIFQHCFRSWVSVVQATSHYLNRCWFVYRCIYTSLDLNELKSVIRPEKNIIIIGLVHSTYKFCNNTWYLVFGPTCMSTHLAGIPVKEPRLIIIYFIHVDKLQLQRVTIDRKPLCLCVNHSNTRRFSVSFGYNVYHKYPNRVVLPPGRALQYEPSLCTNGEYIQSKFFITWFILT